MALETAELPEPDFALSIVCCFGFLTSGDEISTLHLMQHHHQSLSTKQLVSRTHLLRSHRCTTSWSLPNPGRSHHYSIGIPVPVPRTSSFPVNKILAVILCLLIAYCMWVKSVPKTMTQHTMANLTQQTQSGEPFLNSTIKFKPMTPLFVPSLSIRDRKIYKSSS
ncbi:hypothetical protein ILYODFUR_003470 [Ilyodon furcidens]|uniref:Uncharacterized protein n=1 Tax=Ilyodon furcidens TaxID=33524 RepID=A0ABV0URQ6_9TELE